MTELVDIVLRQRGAKKVVQGIQQVKKESTDTNSAVGFLKRSLLTLGAGVGAKEIIQMTDALNLARGRLRLVTKNTEELTAVQSELFKISRDNRVGFTDTVDLYTRLARSTKNIGTSQADLLQTTEAVNQAIQISGVSADSANAALVQLGQGLASGALRGDELRSVLEQVPRLAEAIADGLGVTTGELRELGAEGALTAEAVLGAIQSQAPKLAAEFEKVPVTFGSALTVMGNSFQQFLGIMEDSGGVIDTMASGILSVADILSDPAFSGTIIATFEEWNVIVGEIGQGFDQLGQIAVGVLKSIGVEINQDAADAQSFGKFLLDAFTQLPANVMALIKIGAVEIASFIEKTKARFDALIDGTKSSVQAIFSGETTVAGEGARVSKQLEERLALLEKVRMESIDGILQEKDQRKSAHEERIAQIVREAEAQADTSGILGEANQVDAFMVQAEALRAAEEAEAEKKAERAALRSEKEVERQALADEARLLALEESALTELELEELKFQRKMEFLENFAEGEVKLIETKDKLIEKLSRQHNAKLGKTEAIAALRRQRFEQMSLTQRTQSIFGFLQNITAGTADSNKKMFNINKAAGVAQAVISGIKGVATTLGTYPFPINIPLAAVHAVAAFAQVQKLRSATYGGGGNITAPSGGTPTIPTLPAIEPSSSDAQLLGTAGEADTTLIEDNAQASGSRTVVNLAVEPGIRDQQSIVELFEQMNEAIGDNMKFDVRVA